MNMITELYLPVKILFGAGSLDQLGSEARNMGRKAMLVTGSSSMRKTGVLDRAIKDLNKNGIETYIFDKVEPNPRNTTVDAGADIVRSHGIDLIIGMGGGSAMDAAKCIALTSSNSEPIWRYTESEIEAKGSVPSLILVPTVAASGSEINNGAAITNWETHEKRGLFSPHFFARVSIIDPELTLTMPRRLTAQGGVDIFCHLAERYLTTRRISPISDGLYEAVMNVVVDILPLLLSRLDDIEARTQLSWAGTLGASQFRLLGGIGGAMTLHGIEHALSGYYDIAHGDGLAALLPTWMRHILEARRERFGSLGRNVFGETDGMIATEKWLDKVGMKLHLRDLGVKLESIEAMANCAFKVAPWLKYHPVSLDSTAVAGIFRDSF